MSTDNQLAEQKDDLRQTLMSALGEHTETPEEQEETQDAAEVETEQEQAEEEQETSEAAEGEEAEFQVREDLEATYNYLKKEEKEFLKESKLPNELIEKYLEKVKNTNTAFHEKTKNFSDLRRVIEPFEDSLAMQGITSAQKISQYIAIEKQLMANPLEGILQLAKSYGVDLVKSLEEKQSTFEDPALAKISELEKKLSEFEQNTNKQVELTQKQQQEAALKEVESFKNAKDEKGVLKYPHFEKIKLNMSAKFQEGSANSLQEAYDLVIKELGLNQATPIHRKSVKDARASAGVRSKSAASSLTTEGLSLRDELKARFTSSAL